MVRNVGYQTGRASLMGKWRIRIRLSDDAQSRARLDEVLADQQVSAVQLTPRPGTDTGLSGDVVLELPRDDKLGDMLTALHMISPQVFVSRASSDHDELDDLDSPVGVLAPVD
jgi:hypothetical protein